MKSVPIVLSPMLSVQYLQANFITNNGDFIMLSPILTSSLYRSVFQNISSDEIETKWQACRLKNIIIELETIIYIIFKWEIFF